jgi:dihydrofolate reductase
MAFKLIESAQARWRVVNAPHLVALVRACATFERGQLVERPDETESGGGSASRVTRQSTGYDHGMPKLIVSVLTSLDGYYEGPDKGLASMPFEDAFNTHNLGLLQRAGTLVYGSTWFPGNWEHWSAVAADESQNDRDHEIAELVTSLDAVVISDSMKVDPDAPWAATTRVVSRAEAPKEIARLKRGSGDDLLMFGSATTWNPLLADGLVDELVVLVGAALLGDGSKLYAGSRAGLKLLAARVLPDSQLVELRYDATGAGD